MADGESMDQPSGLPPDQAQVLGGGSGRSGVMEKLDIYMKLAKKSVEAVQGKSLLKLNNEQCGYLVDKLEVAVQSASSFLEQSRAQVHGPYLPVHIARQVETFKLLLALAKQIESFVEGCCKEAWLQSAFTLMHVAGYVSSLGFNLELCRAALGKERGARGSLTLDEVEEMSRDEEEMVEKKAFEDAASLLKKVGLELTSSRAEECNLAKYVLYRLAGMGTDPTSEDESIFVKLFEWVTSGKRAEQLGRGASAAVYKAMWLGTPVAKKTFDWPENREFLEEVKILSRLCHPNITSMFCCNMNKRSCSIIMELMDGNLHDLMQSRLEKNDDYPPFSILEGVDIMLQVGEGVNYLHDNWIVHRDLKSMNILVKSVEAPGLELGYVHVKVADFGLSKTKERSSTYSNMTYNAGTCRWMAPELIKINGSNEGSFGGSVEPWNHKYKCDIYSFAMVCFEILTGELPFNGGSGKNVKEEVLKGSRPRIPEYCPSMLKSLIEKCWRQKPMERPSMGDVCAELKYLKYLLMTNIFIERKMAEAAFRVNPSTLHDDEPPRKRIRTRNWSAEETSALLHFVLLFLEEMGICDASRTKAHEKGPPSSSSALLEFTEEALRKEDVDIDNWDYVSGKLWGLGFDRASNSCRRRCNTLLKWFDAIRDHDSCSCVSYREMDEDERSKNNLPLAFDLEWCETIERIRTAGSFDEETSSIQSDADLPSSADSELDEVDSRSEDEELSGPAIQFAELESEAALLSTQSSQRRPENEILTRMPEEYLFSEIAPFVNKHIKDALEPFASLLRSLDDEQKRREELLASEKQKLARKREKMQTVKSRAFDNSNALPARLPQNHPEPGSSKPGS